MVYFTENISVGKVYVCLPVLHDLFLLDHYVSCGCRHDIKRKTMFLTHT